MLKNVIRAFLVFRLELQDLPIDLNGVLALWRHRPGVEILLTERAKRREKRELLLEKLNEVYPF